MNEARGCPFRARQRRFQVHAPVVLLLVVCLDRPVQMRVVEPAHVRHTADQPRQLLGLLRGGTPGRGHRAVDRLQVGGHLDSIRECSLILPGAGPMPTCRTAETGCQRTWARQQRLGDRVPGSSPWLRAEHAGQATALAAQCGGVQSEPGQVVGVALGVDDVGQVMARTMQRRRVTTVLGGGCSAACRVPWTRSRHYPGGSTSKP